MLQTHSDGKNVTLVQKSIITIELTTVIARPTFERRLLVVIEVQQLFNNLIWTVTVTKTYLLIRRKTYKLTVTHCYAVANIIV